MLVLRWAGFYDVHLYLVYIYFWACSLLPRSKRHPLTRRTKKLTRMMTMTKTSLLAVTQSLTMTMYPQRRLAGQRRQLQRRQQIKQRCCVLSGGCLITSSSSCFSPSLQQRQQSLHQAAVVKIEGIVEKTRRYVFVLVRSWMHFCVFKMLGLPFVLCSQHP